MNRYVHFFINTFIVLTLPIAGLCQEQDFDGRKRGVGGVIEGHTVSEVQKAYGNEYGSLVNEFYNAVHNIDGNIDVTNASLASQLDTGSLNQYPQGNDGREPQALEVMIDILKQVYSNGKYEAVPVADGDTLTRDDYYKITFQSNTPCYMYIIQLDTTGRMDPLFPSRFSILNNPVRAGEFYEVPLDKNWFFLDENKGTETVYFIVCREQRTDLDTVFQEIEERNTSLVQQNRISMENPALLQRGIAGVRPGDSLTVNFNDGTKGEFDSTMIQSIQAEMIMTRQFYHR